MHKIIQIKDNPESASSPGSNGHHYNSSHEGLAPSSLRNGAHRENGFTHGVHETETDTDDETHTTPLRADNRARNAKRKGTDWRKMLAYSLASAIPIIFPALHMLLFTNWWGHTKTPVDTRTCTCSCFDTIFKGPYESGIAGFKHVYFNCDGNTLKMWTITVLWVLFFYEALKRLFLLLLSKNLRWTMGFLFLSSLHSHYYAWWAHWNYLNDHIYHLWYHQVFFTVTELISSVLVLKFLDVRRSVEPVPMLVVCSIAVFHALCSGWDQFFFSVILGQGEAHKKPRDVALMLTDSLHASLSMYEVRAYAVRNGTSLFSILIHKKNLGIVCLVMASMYALVLLFP